MDSISTSRVSLKKALLKKLFVYSVASKHIKGTLSGRKKRSIINMDNFSLVKMGSKAHLMA